MMRDVPAAVAIRDLPDDGAGLIARLSSALRASNIHKMPITEIQVPLDRYPNLASTFWHIHFEDTPEPKVRVIYAAAPRPGPRAAANN